MVVWRRISQFIPGINPTNDKGRPLENRDPFMVHDHARSTGMVIDRSGNRYAGLFVDDAASEKAKAGSRIMNSGKTQPEEIA